MEKSTKEMLTFRLNQKKLKLLSTECSDNGLRQVPTHQLTTLLDALKADLLGGADAVFDTLKELQTAILDDQTGIAALLAAVDKRVAWYTKIRSLFGQGPVLEAAGRGGRAQAWMPGQSGLETVRIDASEIIHLYKVLRRGTYGASRGSHAPWSSSMNSISTTTRNWCARRPQLCSRALSPAKAWRTPFGRH